MLQTIQTYIQSHRLLNAEDRVLVALSGGADSVCLLQILRLLGYEVVAAHCNFHLRGTESDRDEQFVRDLCNSLSIDLHITHFATTDYAAAKGISLEMAARELRYEWFEQLRTECGCVAIAVAHHMNDQAETLLLNLKRGTGVSGLGGMRPKNGMIIRPLLAITRRQIELYCQTNHWEYVTDSTNSDTEIRRNAIRAILAASSEVEIQHMAHTAELMQQYDSLLQALLYGQEIPAESQSSLLFELLSPYGFNSSQVEDVLKALPASGKRFVAPNYTAYIDHGQLTVVANNNMDEEQTPTLLRAVRPRMTREHFPPADALYASFDADQLPEHLMLRHWKEGDYFYPICNGGKSHKKKLQDFFSDQKLSLQDKDKVWLLCNAEQPDEIIWIVGQRISNPYKITDATTQVAELEVEL